ncbi:hypothetical protein ACIO3O_28545 [Streptomyces sp. NPDC087440]|uniref:hypothetical protein n=1 Tax=Streptomyces sp. NPDC087440 TaxID=3365790 RepID=UPI0037FD9B8A
MRTYIGHQEVLSVTECWELAVGDDAELPDGFRELFLGEADESGSPSSEPGFSVCAALAGSTKAPGR